MGMASPDNSDPVLYEVANYVATITLNRPERRNAISMRMLQQLAERLEQADRDRDLRAIVLTGAAPGGFFAGLDLVDAPSCKRIGSDTDGRTGGPLTPQPALRGPGRHAGQHSRVGGARLRAAISEPCMASSARHPKKEAPWM